MRTRTRARRADTLVAAIAALIGVAALAGPARAAAEPAPGQAFDVMVASSGTGPAADATSIAAALARSPALDAILLAPAGTDAADAGGAASAGSAAGGAVEAAARAGCAIAIRVESETLPTGDARSAWKVIDPLKGAILAEGVIEGQEPTARDLAEFWWLPLVAAAEDAAGAAGPLGRAPWVRVEAAPGTRISGLSAAGDAIGSRAEGSGSAVAVVPESGFLALGLRVPGTYEWRAEAAGAYPESGTFFAAEPGATLSVPRRPLRRWMLEAGLFMAQYPDLWAAWRFAEDRFFLRLGLGQFMAGLYLVDEEYGTETPSAFSSLPLVQPGAGLGWYAMPPDSPVRPYALASASARVSVATETGLAIDPVAPWIVAAAIGAEWPIARAWSLFLEIGAAFYPLCDGALLASSRGYSGIGSPIYGDGWLLEAPTMRFGARVSF